MFHVYFYYAVLSVPYSLVVTCWERADLLVLLYVVFTCHFHIWFSESGMVLDCIDSLSLPSSLLCLMLYTPINNYSVMSVYLAGLNQCKAIPSLKTT